MIPLAYLDAKTYEIFQGGCMEETSDQYFEVDDMIAPAIRILNRKGYKTEYCCAGHPFPTLNLFEYLANKETDKEDLMDYLSSIPDTKAVSCNSDGNILCVARSAAGFTSLYINFSIEIKIPFIPAGAELEEDNTLRIEYEFENTDSFKQICECMDLNRKIYNWACMLPPVNKT